MIHPTRKPGRGRGGKQRQSGFSLLELLVAFSIMAMSLGLLYRVAGGSLRSVSDVSQHQQATWLAESLLASRQVVRADGWNESGESGSYTWQVRSNPYPTSLNGPKAVPLHEIQIDISWPMGARTGRLQAVTLLPEQKPPPGSTVR